MVFFKTNLDSDRTPFLTGSQVYGIPNESSDIDIVMLVDEETKQKLTEFSDFKCNPVKFRKLNLILVTTYYDYDNWKKAKDECLRLAPRTKQEAILIHNRIRGTNTYNQQSGDWT